jgi:enterochelin esterase-like enzyme
MSHFGDDYAKLMLNDMIPWVDSNFRTIADRDHRAMAGLSMGSMITASVTTTHLDTFSYIGLFSGGTLGARPGGPGGPGGPVTGAAQPPTPLDLKNSLNGVMADPAEFNKKVHVYYFSCGSVERPESMKIHQQQLIDAGITNGYVYISPGTAHEWQTWRRSLYTYSQLLFK